MGRTIIAALLAAALLSFGLSDDPNAPPGVHTVYGEGPSVRPSLTLSAAINASFSVTSDPPFDAFEAFGTACVQPAPGELLCEAATTRRPVVLLRYPLGQWPQTIVIVQGTTRSEWTNEGSATEVPAPSPLPERMRARVILVPIYR
jgi:hypothetical protein